MATQPTQDAVPSESPRDLKFNAGKIDEFVTSENHVYVDRFGDEHRTIAGINYDANQAILNYGYITKDSFEDGSTISLANECLRWKSNGEYYRWDGTFPKVVPPGSTPETTGGIGEGKWIGVGDASLRSNLAAPDGYQLIGGLSEHYSLPSSTIVVDNAPYNGDLKAALNAAPEGATLLLGKTTAYNIVGLYSGSRNTKKNILIVGMGMPELSADKSRFVEGSGTIIRGSVKNEAKGFKIFNLGIDCGNYVSQSLYSPVTYEDGLQIDGAGTNANIGLHNVKVLNSVGISSNPQTHSILLQNFDGGTMGYIECIGGFHGLAIKCQNLRGGHAHCYMQYGDAFIFKSDSAAVCRSVHIDTLTVGLADGSGWPSPVSYGGIYDAHDNVGVSDIHIGKLNIINASWGLIPADQSTGFITQVTIGQICGIQVYGNYYAIEINSKCVNWTISSHQFSGVSGGIRVNPSAVYCHIGNGSVTGSSVFGYSIGGDTNTHGAIISNANNVGVEFTGGLGFNPSLVTAYGNNSGNFSALPSVISAAPVNNWSQGADFKATSMGHMVHISGSFVRGATSGLNMVQLLSTAQPPQAVTLMAWSSDTGAVANVYVDTDGFIKCGNFNTIASGAVVKIMGSYLKK
ncbi:phage tail protein [Enterobacter chuandaensis]|uniref:tail fiber/spike domain-containing protein n=1 Tax=Enterobacter chuandaensis TaxID=2497875 RepID=UPI00300C328A